MKHMVILDKTIVYVKDWKVYIYQYIYIIYSFGKYGKKLSSLFGTGEKFNSSFTKIISSKYIAKFLH